MKYIIIILMAVPLQMAQAQWIKLNENVSADFKGIHMLSHGEGWVVGNAGSVYHLTNNGFTWNSEPGVPVNKDLEDVCFVTNSTGSIVGWAVGEDGNEIVRRRPTTPNSISSWETLPTQQIFDLNAVSCIERQTSDNHFIWGVGGSGAIIHNSRSGDGGTFGLQGAAFAPLRDVFFINMTTGWAVGDEGAIERTENGGASWDEHNYSDNSNFLHGVYFADRDTGWAVALDGTILKSVDRGITWSEQNSGTTSPLYAIDGIDAQHLIAVGNDNTILRTSNGGTNWVPETQTGLTGNFRDVVMLDSMNYWVIGMAGSNYYSLGEVEITSELPSEIIVGTTYEISFRGRFNEHIDIIFPDRTVTDYPIASGPISWTVPNIPGDASISITAASPNKKEYIENYTQLKDNISFAIRINDQTGPIINAPVVTPPMPPKGASVEISSTIEDVSDIESAFLWYRVRGQSYKSVEMTRVGSVFNTTIPTTDVTILGPGWRSR